MIIFPNAKINIGLNILRKRPDNFHDLQTIFFPVNIKDALEVVVRNEITDYEFINTGLKIDAPAEKNLVVKAYKLLKEDYKLPAVKIHLHKVIPFGAGLGGGSADAAFMIILLNNMFNLNLSTEQMLNYARSLGSDCSFFILNEPCFATEKGDKLENISLDLSQYKIIIVKPELNLNTTSIYSHIRPNDNVENLKDLIKEPIDKWKDLIFNDFENVIFDRHPEIKKIKNRLYSEGAVYAAMSGSGSSVFGIFNKAETPDLSGLPVILK